jgi:hypothetical protein
LLQTVLKNIPDYFASISTSASPYIERAFVCLLYKLVNGIDVAIAPL